MIDKVETRKRLGATRDLLRGLNRVYKPNFHRDGEGGSIMLGNTNVSEGQWDLSHQ